MKVPHIPSKIKIAVFIAGGLFGIYTALGFYLLPMLVKSKLPALIQQQTGRKASVATVRFDPFSLQLSLQGFALQEPDDRLFVGFDGFFIDINALQSISQTALVIDKVSLNKPVVRIAKGKDGTFNFKDLFKDSNEAKQDDGKVFPVNIAKLSMTEGKLDWEDAHFSSPEKETAYPINLVIDNLTTQADKPSNLGLSLELNSGGKLDWQGAISLNPLSSSGHIKLEKVQLPRIRALALQDFVQLDLQGYELFEADYKAAYVNNQFNVNLNQGKFELHDFQVSQNSQDKPLVKMVRFAVQGIGFNLEKHELTVESVSANDADFKAWLNPDGVFSYQPLLPIAKADEAPGEPVEKTSWSIKVNNIALNNCGLTFEDQTLKKPITIIAKPINFQLTNFNNEAGASLPFQLSVGLNESGLIKLDGNTVIEPLSAQIAVDVKDIDLEKFQAYVDKFARLDVINGALAIDGKLLVAKSAQDKLDIKFTGNTKIADLITRDQLKNKDFVKWENLALNGMDVDFPANQYSAETLIINKPYARVIIKQDKSINFGDIMIADKNVEKGKQDATVKAAKNTQTDAQKPKFKLGKIQVIDGSSDFSDLSLILPFAAQIKSLDGGANNISSDQKSTIKVDLKGTAYDLAPVDVKGEISPYLGDYDVTVNFTGMPMPLISSYMVQFAGYKVEKGKMSLELNYKVANRELTASNNILIDQFELGEKVENPNAVSLPLELAVALMKDSEGKIKIHVPISGSLEDPKFSVSHIFVDALVNSISKVITSPFRALASLIGSEEDLSTIDFAAGDAVLTKSQISKLGDLAKALKARPVLKLEIKGAAYQEQDWPAVSDDALYDQLKRIKAAEVNKQGGRKVRAEHVVISDQDYRRLMEQLFAEKFPLMVEKSLLGTLRLVGSKADTSTDEFYAVAKQKLSAIIKPEEQRLKNLAAERAQAIANYIVQKGGIANERVFILDTAIDPAREGNGIVSLLSLKAD
ncbi:uncharacterized protein DUF748 [Methylobacter tundripaludum]|uniref:Uncharacterized protein DUF748 n=1 Tax=Methylobacter tundripaludum TaxID=173365 RepID=A0A2S6H628_9GAMM|nr:DUF748 domain-containing protein [Methylobacter tundripaludum]PPK72935.1 uncharacterized protein DUF748 [Methylobacter tundripaludum]